jgi:hypothetical protein
VDALCIVQDDTLDKLEEISKMGSIYKNATLTIAAASASKVSDGFLTSPKDDSLLARLPFYLDKQSSGVIYINRYDGGSIVGYHEDGPLFERGWAMQELPLSPRTLIFDAYQITLNCRTNQFKSIVPIHIKFYPLCASLPMFIHSSRPTILSHYPDKSTWNWKEQAKVRAWLIEEYTARDLTLFNDRLPVLSDIVSELRPYLGHGHQFPIVFASHQLICQLQG